MNKLIASLLLLGIANFSIAQSSYFPIKKGSIMTYAYSKELYQGQNFDVSQLKMTVTISTETKNIDGMEYFISTTSTGGLSPNFTSYFRIDSDGAIWAISEEGKQESIMMNKNPKVGDTWTTSKGSFKSTSKVIDLSGSITTPTGSYSDCMVVESTENGATSKAYFHPGTGMVAVAVSMGGSDKLFVYLTE